LFLDLRGDSSLLPKADRDDSLRYGGEGF